jgi:ribosomal protein RSM22 (predicted rRNA methylase)
VTSAEAPADLPLAIARVTARAATADLARAARRLSERYRAGNGPYVLTSEDAVAYVATRLPATYAAARCAAEHVAELWPAWMPSSQLDLGAGPGAAAWAAASVWPAIGTAVLTDRDEHMMTLGEQLATDLPQLWTWERVDVMTIPGGADLVTCCYTLGELEPAIALEVATKAWEVTGGCLLLVEPGTPAGFHLIRQLRQHLLGEGARLLAPCPDEGACPIAGDDWCHFSARVGRSALHRNLKAAERSFEDEKFSYVAFAREHVSPASGRVVRRPVHRRRFVELAVCADGVIRRAGLGQSSPAYRAASKLAWGAVVPSEVMAQVRPLPPS